MDYAIVSSTLGRAGDVTGSRFKIHGMIRPKNEKIHGMKKVVRIV